MTGQSSESLRAQRPNLADDNPNSRLARHVVKTDPRLRSSGLNGHRRTISAHRNEFSAVARHCASPGNRPGCRSSLTATGYLSGGGKNLVISLPWAYSRIQVSAQSGNG